MENTTDSIGSTLRDRRTFLSQIGRGALAWGAAGALSAGAGSAACAARAAGDGIDPDERAAMDALAWEFMTGYKVPGMSVAIARKGRLVFAEGYGLADRTTNEPVVPAHLFRIASIAKPLTAVCVLRLAEQGHFRLDDRVFAEGTLLGNAYGAQPYGQGVEDITLRHLLEHTPGGWSNDDHDPMFQNSEWDHARLISWVLDNRPLNAPPGQAYAYSNFGYCLVGRIIERATGLPYADAVRQEVLTPCGISNMHLAGNAQADRRADEVIYYGQRRGEDPYGMNVTRMDAHGGWLASATYLVRLAVRVDGFDTVADMLGADSIRQMSTPSAANGNYALGWMVNSNNNWWHTGSLPGTSTILVRTSGEFCWAVLTNTRRLSGNMGGDLDRLPWNMTACVSRWPDVDLF